MIGMTFAHVGGNLDLRGATLSELDLAGASIAGDLRVGGGNDFKSALWTKPGTLNLHNVQCGNLMDAMDAWPAEGSSISTDSVSRILAATKATPDRKCAIGEWNGGTNIGRGAIESAAPLPTRNSRAH
jgi:hypothetical protein